MGRKKLLRIKMEAGPSVVFVERTKGSGRRFLRRWKKDHKGSRMVIDWEEPHEPCAHDKLIERIEQPEEDGNRPASEH